MRSLPIQIVIGLSVAAGMAFLVMYPMSCVSPGHRDLFEACLGGLSGLAWCLAAYLAIAMPQGAPIAFRWQTGSNAANLIAAFAAFLTGLLEIFKHYHLPGLCG